MAILFDMNELWEEFVFRRLLKAVPEGVSVSRQNKARFWYNETHDFNKWVRPDIVVTNKGRKIILDTKWKIIDDNRPGDNDLKQMFVYNLLWGAERSFLIYPGVNQNSSGSYLHFPLSSASSHNQESEFYNSCEMYFLNVVGGDGELIGLEPFSDLLDFISKEKKTR